MNEELLKEEKYLVSNIKLFNKLTIDADAKIKELTSRYNENPLLYADLIEQNKRRLKMVERTKDKPYFARIDFKEGKEKLECYIGKVGINDEENRIITYDWRSPIATLYYDSSLGNATYIAPAGLISGFLSLKRMYEIEEGKLINYSDVDTVSNDEFLKPFLSASADNRLKNIVSTIQSEQNKIIREPINKNIIVQGVAGSGKTTVALHRVAFLIYNYQKSTTNSNYLVIGPNKVFVNYISSILPDLDVEDVKELTLIELIEKSLKIKINIVDNHDQFAKLKTSIEFKNIIDNYLKEYIDNLINEDFFIKNFKILSREEIKTCFNSLNDLLESFEILKRKIDKTIMLLSKQIKNKSESLSFKIRDNYMELIGLKNKNELEKTKKDIISVDKILKSGASSELRNYFKKITPNIFSLYNNILKEIGMEEKSKNKIDYADIPGLLYLNYRINDTNYSDILHVVIDEAQDYGTFTFYALKKMMPHATFSIFGDLAQSIFSYRSIDDWDSVVNESFNGDAEISYLLKSYRTTTEIVNEANQVIRHLNLRETVPVIRHGEEVKYIGVSNDQIDVIKGLIEKYKIKKYKTIAVICKTKEEVIKISKKMPELTVVDDNFEEYSGGICILTAEAAKGLEFDAVIISDASKKIYDSTSKGDMHLLYVAMTRALHELSILTTDEITEPLSYKNK